MLIRIYALAKQLKLDSKVLVDICAKAGVTGKGSALASLTDEEHATVMAFINSGKAARLGGPAGAHPAASGPSEPTSTGAIRREDYIAPTGSFSGKVPVLPAAKHEKHTHKPVEEPPTPPPAPTTSAPVAEPVEEPPVAPSTPSVEPPPLERPVMRPSDRPIDRPRAGKTLADRVKEKGRQKSRDKERDKDKGPAIKMAPLPAASHMTLRRKSNEPAPQKPDIKLPKDAIRAGRAGTKPLSEHLRKHEQKRAAEAAKGGPRGKSPQAGEAPSGEAATLAGSRDRPRRSRVAGAPPEREEEGVVGAMGGREQRQLKRKKAASARHRKPDEEGGDETTAAPAIRKRTHIRRTGANTAAPRRENVTVELPCTVRSFSEALGVPARTILAKLLEMGTMSNIAATLDPDMAELLATDLGVAVDFRRPVDLEQKVIDSLEHEDDPEKLQPRPPIVTFLGHVDHGKTSLLDRILGIDVAAHEKGGITQHIRAYRVMKDGRPIAFVDTPGHEAFTEMRARGANVTDIAVLVVAAEDGVMPQTEEAISHAKAAEVPIVVAMNKIDLPGANPQRVYEQLAANELLPSEWGGETEVVKTSATTGEGIDKLLETLLTVAELHEYKANPDGPGRGTCLEAEMHEDRGVVVKLLVQNGTLHVGDIVVCGSAYGRVKAMYDTLKQDEKYESVGPSTPVQVTGLDSAPNAGDCFYVLDDIAKARQLAEQRAAEARQRELAGGRPHVTLENLYERLGEESQIRTLNIILRADVRGSIEAIRKELSKLQHPEVQIKILQATVGGVTEADVHLAHASDAVIIAFSVVPDEKARSLAEKLGVQIRRYDIIYQVTDDLRAALEGMLKPEKHEKDLGRALVQQTFHISRVGSVAGCRVLSGIIARDARVRLIRESRVIGDYAMESLKREKDDAREVREGLECGIKLAGFNDIKEGDIFEAYKIEEIARTF
ncbi:MAG: translation initiation factor IF-2 [Thermoguttaceae bacterium]